MAEFPSAIFDLVDQGIAGLYDGDGLGVCMDQNHIRGTHRPVARMQPVWMVPNLNVLQEVDKISLDGFWHGLWGIGHGSHDGLRRKGQLGPFTIFRNRKMV
jgi:hypothetical protein